MNLRDACKEKVLIVAHRGVAAGNIPCNTLPAYEIAVREGADMIEIDVDASSDGVLIIQHPWAESAHLNFRGRVTELTFRQIADVLRHSNYDGATTQWPICTLDEVFETFKGRCFINVDKFWEHPAKIAESIRRHNIADQVLVKSAPNENTVKVLTEVAPELPFMPIYNYDKSIENWHERLKNSAINYVGAELVFEREDAPTGLPAVEMLGKEGLLLFGNAIIYDFRAQLAAGHSDDAALGGYKVPEGADARDYAWGWLAERFDLIQTDWPLELRLYLESTGRRLRK